MKQTAPPAWLTPTQPKGRAVSSFKVTKKLPPGTPGAQKLLQRIGDALVCVRHRVTPDGEARCTTVELVLEQVPIRSRGTPLVGVQVDYCEKALQSQVKAAGVWDPALRCGSCRNPRLDNWAFRNASVRCRNEIDMESVSIQKSCIYPNPVGCSFGFCGLN